MRVGVLLLTLGLLLSAASGSAPPGVITLQGASIDPFAKSANIHVFLFARTDCPITNRYAPELQRIAADSSREHVDFWIVYSDRHESAAEITRHMTEYQLPGTPIRDARHELAQRAQATIAPQAAVFDHSGRLMYSGRIDDRYIRIGQSRPQPTTHDLQSAIATVLAGKQPEPAKTRAVGCYLSDLN